MAATHSANSAAHQRRQQRKFTRAFFRGRLTGPNASDPDRLGKNADQPVLEKRKERIQRNRLALKNAELPPEYTGSAARCLRQPRLQQRFHCWRQVLRLHWAERALYPMTSSRPSSLWPEFHLYESRMPSCRWSSSCAASNLLPVAARECVTGIFRSRPQAECNRRSRERYP